MYLRKKGEYYQIVETKGQKQVVLGHLGRAERVLDMLNHYKRCPLINPVTKIPADKKVPKLPPQWNEVEKEVYGV